MSDEPFVPTDCGVCWGSHGCDQPFKHDDPVHRCGTVTEEGPDTEAVLFPGRELDEHDAEGASVMNGAVRYDEGDGVWSCWAPAALFDAHEIWHPGYREVLV